MATTLIIGEDALNPLTWEKFIVDDVCEFLYNRWTKFPDTARIYHNQICKERDVTPCDERTIARLNELEGELYVVVYPEGIDPVSAVIIGVLVIGAATLLTPSVPKVAAPSAAQRNRKQESSNNELSDRENRARPNSRIPDIFGSVRSTPDLLSLPLTVYENQQQVEFAYMCAGRGDYGLDEDRIFDDATKIKEISGTTVEVYGPNTSPNSGDSPVLTIGDPITRDVKNVHKSNSVNGQTLRAPNSQKVVGENDFSFKAPNEINASGAKTLDQRFQADDEIIVTNATATVTITTGGDELVSNGGFTGGTTGWTLGTGWAYGTNDIVKTAGVASDATTAVTVSDGELIDTSFEVTAYTAGNVRLRLSNSGGAPFTLGTLRSAVGVFNETLTAQAGQNQLDIVADSAFDGTIDNVSALSEVVSTPTAIDLAGTYTITSVSSNQILLDTPSSVNSDWTVLANSDEGETIEISPTIESVVDKWVGPFTIDVSTTDELLCNFIAPNGLYKDDGKNQYAENITVEIEATPVDASGTPTGAAETFQATVLGSETSRSERAVTLSASPTIGGRQSVRARRVSVFDVGFEGNVVDEIKWRDLYALSDPGKSDFGNITTIWSKTIATTGALAIKSRKLNLDVTRKVPVRVSGTTFTSPQASDRIDDVFVAVSTDQYIGNRSLDELDLDSIYDTVAEVETYFGTDKAVSFGYTFDSDNMSYEETAASVAAVCFCNAYRQGSQIKFSFEKETPDSVILFNHRNKLPNSETRVVSFGNNNDNDGVELEYVDPTDGAIETYYVPIDQTAVNPKKIETIGIKSKLLAHFHAWRAYNKILKQNINVEFQATQEADILVLNERILVADNTRTGTQDGEVDSYAGLTVTTTQPMTVDPLKNYVMFLQHYDGTVEAIDVASFPSSYEAVLTQAPKLSLVTDLNYYARATYLLVEDTETAMNAFLVVEKDTQSNMTSNIRAINYDDGFYANDKDLIDGVVDENGEYL